VTGVLFSASPPVTPLRTVTVTAADRCGPPPLSCPAHSDAPSLHPCHFGSCLCLYLCSYPYVCLCLCSCSCFSVCRGSCSCSCFCFCFSSFAHDFGFCSWSSFDSCCAPCSSVAGWRERRSSEASEAGERQNSKSRVKDKQACGRKVRGQTLDKNDQSARQ
jgi:hypothetical protein